MAVGNPKLKDSIELEEKSAYITRTSEAGMMLVDYKTNEVFEANETASIIVRLCDGKHTVDEIVDEIYANYDAQRSVIEKDVNQILKKMSEMKIIEM
ncbi:MAG: coenzyme PQQ biosynthesis protein D [Candidatus Syntrophoarchaeum caldarius]|uniref:Coenzyme PQQ biosynthesis protein D n=1 Tax=Candidatus Syntropharchaeum caldarium TaxID=1838285 RepID=A0A1F2P9U9_9EURY|nr:MAG: coenzyme PQQ biosynthesis protein D [Candidatus Syntrophoarchaeum caldarius]